MMKGKVYLIGAGPGDPQLLTIKAVDAINRADVILYDCLVSPEILDMIDKTKKLLCVGKRGKTHIKEQDEINRELYGLASEGKVVARLKGGDPYLFGRGGEEAEFLAERGVDFEIIPGVSSALASPAYAGIPVTHRNFTSSCTIITGHRKDDKKIDWSLLAKMRGTIVILMGTERISEITKRLMEEGMPEDTPSAVIRWGTTPYQETVTARLKDIATAVKERGMDAPCVIVIGDVVSLREKLSFWERKPLFGKRVLILRPKEQSDNIYRLLSEAGAEVIRFPVIDIVPLDFKTDLAKYEWLVFTSTNGVRCFFGRVEIREIKANIAVIGEKTKKEVERFKAKADLMPKRFCQEELLKALIKKGIEGAKIAVISSDRTRKMLYDHLKREGADVQLLPVYSIRPTERDPGPIIRRLKRCEIDLICFTSPSTFESLLYLIKDKELLQHPKIAVIGPVTARRVKEEGILPHITAKIYTDEGLFEDILSFFSS
jgi:uroporphyrinogen III methyltransferase/synthase